MSNDSYYYEFTYDKTGMIGSMWFDTIEECKKI